MIGKMDYDDSKNESVWLDEQKDNVAAYLKNEDLSHGKISERPDWFVAPYVSIWRIAGIKNPKTTGWWAISGDLPTDYCSSKNISNARDAMRHFAKTWDEVSSYMLQGKPHPEITIGKESDWPELGDLLSKRSKILQSWAEDDELWN
jgi:hypothetical protein